jgi:dienelactone hydrolase
MLPTTTNFTSTGNTIQAELFNPTGTPNRGAIIIAHGSDGMVNNSNGPWLTMMRGFACDLADKGFVTLMPNYFGGINSVDFLQISLYQATLADAVAFAKTLPGIDAARIGLLGFSLGGHLCLRNRALTKVLVEFFAPELPELGGIGTAGNPMLHAQIHHGDKDSWVPLKLNAEPIEQKLRTEGADVTLFPYSGAGHGFSGKHPGDVTAQQKSKERTLAFFEKNL